MVYGILKRSSWLQRIIKDNPNIVTEFMQEMVPLAEYAIQRVFSLPINVIPKKVINAFISAEDKDFA